MTVPFNYTSETFLIPRTFSGGIIWREGMEIWLQCVSYSSMFNSHKRIQFLIAQVGIDCITTPTG